MSRRPAASTRAVAPADAGTAGRQAGAVRFPETLSMPAMAVGRGLMEGGPAVCRAWGT